MEAGRLVLGDAAQWLDLGMEHVLLAEECRDETQQLRRVIAAFPRTDDPAYYAVREHHSRIEMRLSELAHEKKQLYKGAQDMERECRRALSQAIDRFEAEEAAAQPSHNPVGSFERYKLKQLKDEVYRIDEAREMLQEAKRILDTINI